MRYKALIFVVVLLATLLVAMELDKGIESKVLGAGDAVRMFFVQKIQGFKEWKSKYFDQAEQIVTLRQKVADYENLALQNHALINENKRLNTLFDTQHLTNNPIFHRAFVSAFVRLGEYERVWLTLGLDTQQSFVGDEERIVGLIHNNTAIGIGKFENGRLMGLLNGEKNCSYGVFIGEDRALGILEGKSDDGEHISVRYIQRWRDIKIGDEVYTNGLDEIFLPNVPVGKVINIYEDSGFLRADVLPYANTSNMDYIWVVDMRNSVDESIDENTNDESSEIEERSQIQDSKPNQAEQ